MENSLFDAARLSKAWLTLLIHGGTLAGKGYVGGSGAKEAYNGNEYHPDYVTALRCIERMIPRPVVIETDNRKFQWQHSADSEYQCPLCGSPLIALEDEVASDVMLHCQNCGQALEWED